MGFVSSDGLALNGQAPRIFSRTSKSGLPWVSVVFCSLFALIAFMGISTGPGKGQASWSLVNIAFATDSSSLCS
jgi:amino acid permease